MKKAIIMLIMSLLTLTRTGAQYYETGQDPASFRWLQIRTPNFRVIYPDDFGEEAFRYARLLQESFDRLSVLYPGVKKNIPVIIHNHSMQSNGYVSWAPRRMELYPLPGQDNLPMDPAAQLAVHEATHVLQLGSLNSRGFGRAMSWILGEQAAGLSALQIPNWAFEGDAVYAETATGLSGRGRSNTFIKGAKALAASPEGIYGYDKMLAGSYRHFTPDYYVFGYLMMNHLRNVDGKAWEKVTDRVASGYFLNPVNNALRRETGLTKKRLYDSTFALLEKAWNENPPEGVKDYQPLSTRSKRDYVSHYTPHRLEDGTIVSLRTSMSAPSRFVITDPGVGKEKVVTTTGYVYPYIFSFSGSTIVWSEQYPDIRWENRDYSVIKKLDIASGTVITLTSRTRYTAPDLSPDGNTIVAVSTTPELRCSLVFLDAYTGEVLMNVVPPGNLILQRPAWSSDGREVTMVTLGEKGEGIRTYRPTGKKWTVNIEESVSDIIQAEIRNDTLYFLAQGDGSDNIYRIPGDGSVERVTGSRFGISGFSISGNELLFSDYTKEGLIIASEKTSFTAGPAGSSGHEIIPAPAPLPVEKTEPAGADPDMGSRPAPVISAPVPYRKMAHLFNFHSWFPFYGDIDAIRTDPTSVRPGLTLMSQNHLSTLISTLGYEYSDGNHYLHSGITWKGWHPVIDTRMTWGGDQVITRDTSVSQLPEAIGRDLQLNISIYDQLWFAYGKFRQLFMPAVYLNYRNRYTWVPDENAFDRGIVNITGRLYFSNTFRTAYRDINPRWGQVFDFRLTTTPWDNNLYNRRRYARATFFFPGVLPNHSLAIKTGRENQAPARRLLYRNSIPWPRGYNDDLVAEKLFSLSADYTMPLLYPDLSAGGLFYLKRIRGTLFYDYSTGEGVSNYTNRTYNREKTAYSSMGSELMADFFLLRIPFEISAGVRAGYIPQEAGYFVNGAFSVNIYGTVLGREQ
ncbi:MAG: hypothetical protein MUE37_07870 [Bacteroidales bacterium]|nr:hypothetical protein [Bacteroidales bacterium]